MSWSGRVHRPPLPAPAPHGRVPHATSPIWHALCFLPLAACFYVKPIPPILVNEPPEILFPTTVPFRLAASGGTVVLSVIASDPDGDALFFEWPDLDNLPYTLDRYAVGSDQVCRVRIEDTSRLPSPALIRAFVFDGTPENTVEVEFEVTP
ncbi:MAG: hypothetical protein H6732_15705 [Alphaproteobacteria bacterium]|nr:hypothetical protein [Alphaproteobacteria bacterium]